MPLTCLLLVNQSGLDPPSRLLREHSCSTETETLSRQVQRSSMVCWLSWAGNVLCLCVFTFRQEFDTGIILQALSDLPLSLKIACFCTLLCPQHPAKLASVPIWAEGELQRRVLWLPNEHRLHTEQHWCPEWCPHHGKTVSLCWTKKSASILCPNMRSTTFFLAQTKADRQIVTRMLAVSPWHCLPDSINTANCLKKPQSPEALQSHWNPTLS